jgi:hypothetical protein
LSASSVFPNSTSDVAYRCGIYLGAITIDDDVAFVAFLTNPLLSIELLASPLDFAANTIFAE